MNGRTIFGRPPQVRSAINRGNAVQLFPRLAG